MIRISSNRDGLHRPAVVALICALNNLQKPGVRKMDASDAFEAAT
jgi:hypothetical protein